ncbi:MAG: alpha/beta hydrolase, partial [bacterium]
MKPMVDQWGELPVDGVQTLFATLDPLLVPRKFLEFSALEPASPGAKDFVALEDWLNDGVPLVAAVAKECLERWYSHIEQANRQWRVAGQAIDPGQIRVPTVAFIP